MKMEEYRKTTVDTGRGGNERKLNVYAKNAIGVL
jgi:hypothetical protein